MKFQNTRDKETHLVEREKSRLEQGTGNQNDVRLSQPQPLKL